MRPPTKADPQTLDRGITEVVKLDLSPRRLTTAAAGVAVAMTLVQVARARQRQRDR